MLTNRLYYNIKPLIPRRLQIAMRRQIVRRKLKANRHIWPIDQEAGKSPAGWPGWPGKKQFTLVLTHDVDTAQGHGKCVDLMDIEKKLGFRSSFNFVPEKYPVSETLRNTLISEGFEVGVHGLNHDGTLFSSKKTFEHRAKRINQYLKSWNALGFASPAMHHNLDWIGELNIKYDRSTFDTDPFEPQPDGVKTIFPFMVKTGFSANRYAELPYTLPQDFTLFVLMRLNTIAIWKEKLDWIAEKGGMALLNTHPDYMSYRDQPLTNETYPASYYTDFLDYVMDNYRGAYWHALPRDVADFCHETL